MKDGWLFQQNQSLTLISRSGEQHTILDNLPLAANIGFKASTDFWQLSVRDNDRLQLFYSTNGINWASIEGVPEFETAEYSFRFLPHKKMFAIFHQNMLHYWSDGFWRQIALPKGGIWGDLDKDNNWNIVGSKAADKTKRALKTEVAYWIQEHNNWKEIPIQASWWDAYSTISNGGFEAIEGIDTTSEPLILASQCAWFLDDSSWFVYTRLKSGKFKIQRLKDRIITQISDNKIMTHDGELWQWNGKKWVPENISTQLKKAFSPAPGYKVHLNFAGTKLFGILSEFISNENKKTAIYSLDSGNSWQQFESGEGTPIATWAL